MSKVQYKLKCIHCNKKTDEKHIINNIDNYLGYFSYYFLYECSNCTILGKLFSEYINSKDKKKFIENMSNFKKCSFVHLTAIHYLGTVDIVYAFNMLKNNYDLYRCDMFKFTNCCNCKIAIRTDYKYITNNVIINHKYDINTLYFCIYCSLQPVLNLFGLWLHELFFKSTQFKRSVGIIGTV